MPVTFQAKTGSLSTLTPRGPWQSSLDASALEPNKENALLNHVSSVADTISKTTRQL